MTGKYDDEDDLLVGAQQQHEGFAVPKLTDASQSIVDFKEQAFSDQVQAPLRTGKLSLMTSSLTLRTRRTIRTASRLPICSMLPRSL